MNDNQLAALRDRQASELAKIWPDNPGSYYRAIRRAALEDGPRDCVYFARSGDTSAIKIGFTHHGLQRLGALRNASPVPVHLEAFINFVTNDEAFAAESRAHLLAQELGSHIRGEWFDLTPEQITKVVKRTIKQNVDVVAGALWKEDR